MSSSTPLPQGLRDDSRGRRQKTAFAASPAKCLKNMGMRGRLKPPTAKGAEVAEQHEGQLDLLLSDVVMPRMGGPELAQALREAAVSVKVLTCRAAYGPSDGSAGVVNAGVAFLQKPFTPTVPVSRVREKFSVAPRQHRGRGAAASLADRLRHRTYLSGPTRVDAVGDVSLSRSRAARSRSHRRPFGLRQAHAAAPLRGDGNRPASRPASRSRPGVPLDGMSDDELTRAVRARSASGFVLQFFNSAADADAPLENVALPLPRAGVSRPARLWHAWSRVFADRVGLSDRLGHTSIAALWRAQMQRAGDCAGRSFTSRRWSCRRRAHGQSGLGIGRPRSSSAADGAEPLVRRDAAAGDALGRGRGRRADRVVQMRDGRIVRITRRCKGAGPP